MSDILKIPRHDPPAAELNGCRFFCFSGTLCRGYGLSRGDLRITGNGKATYFFSFGGYTGGEGRCKGVSGYFGCTEFQRGSTTAFGYKPLVGLSHQTETVPCCRIDRRNLRMYMHIARLAFFEPYILACGLPWWYGAHCLWNTSRCHPAVRPFCPFKLGPGRLSFGAGE